MIKRSLPLAAMEKLMKKAGADRVSDKSKAAMKNVLEDIAKQISARAVSYSKHAGRRTIKQQDIKLASK